MGYSTYYTLKVEKQAEEVREHIENKEYEFPELYEVFTGIGEPIKWYDHQDDMAILSRGFPNVLFTLYGEGEEAGDVWYKYFKNGCVQVCPGKITFDEYDPNKLELV